MVSFGERYHDYTPKEFPIAQVAVVAPYWDDIELISSRQLRYQIVSGASSLITQVNNFVSRNSGVAFNANWILWAYWHNVCPYNDETCTSSQVSKAYIYNVNIAMNFSQTTSNLFWQCKEM